ncbi:CynX/NimT family MFS transporter [Polycladidibacter hongkongensis]|uniref:MFS transporter n=1 Tax=Polycladidibacter hongkongensis TaxID=1647556 RepID=UPI000A9F4BA3|nr:MFS transporter [Pseudovibrio hongkongensis]
MQIQLRTNWFKVLLVWVAGVGAAMQYAKISVSFPHLAETYSSYGTTVSFLISIVGLGGVVFGAAASHFATKHGLKRALISALFFGAVLSVAQSFLPSFLPMLALRIAEGMSHLLIIVSAPTIIASLCEERHRSIAMALWGTFFGIGFAIAGAVSSPVIDMGGVPMLLTLHALWLVIIAVLCQALLPLSKGAEHEEKRVSWANFHREIYADYRNLLPAFSFFCHTSLYVALLTFLPSFVSKDTALLMAAALPVVTILATISAGVLCQWLSPISLTLLAFLTMCVGAISIIFAPHALLASLIYVIMFASGMIQGTCFIMVPFLTRKPEDQARTNGAMAQLGNLGATIGAPVFAFSLASFGKTGVGALAASICCCGAGLLVIALMRWKSREDDSPQYSTRQRVTY